MRDDTTPDDPKENIVHFNPWRDFNDAAPQIDVFSDEPEARDIASDRAGFLLSQPEAGAPRAPRKHQ
ncbi:hypothetical protein JI664_04945 [Rhodobacter sp. NTK016B]|uniref:hypothetical protein n=1 Tax=Rhodobacter sp. NTK016B TaxID=2759676 RepID=UPI001A8F6701|nr:hypothetical protein [Rhodobacter sp. NTK016B]MBN8291302.1 hypothetical protein [Rhodobacter sp. NTK016B]